MSELVDLKANLMKKFENEKNELKSEIQEKFDLMIVAIQSVKRSEKIKKRMTEMTTTNKNLEEQVEVKESEKIEYEEGDLKSSLERAEQLRIQNKKFERQLKDRQTLMYKAFSKSEALVQQIIKYKKKIAEIPAIKESDRMKANTLLENRNYKLNAIKQAINDSTQQEAISLTKIEEIDAKLGEVLVKSEKLTNLIDAENKLADKITQYKEQIIPEIAKEIDKVKMNILAVEKIIEEKEQIKNNSIKANDDFNARFQNEQVKCKALTDNQHNVTKLKNDIINKKVTSDDFDDIPVLKNVVLREDYKKQKDTIRKLKDDNAIIVKDAQDAKDKKDGAEKALVKLKKDMKKCRELSQNKKDEVLSLERDIKDKDAKFDELNDEMLEMIKAIEANELERDGIESKIAELNAESEKLSKQLNREKSLNQSRLKSIDTNVSSNNKKNNVHKWLNDLPQKFTAKCSSSDILSQTSTVNFNDSKMYLSSIHNAQSRNESKVYNVDIEDPEVIDANMECSFSDLNGSDIGLDDSFLNNEFLNY